MGNNNKPKRKPPVTLLSIPLQTYTAQSDNTRTSSGPMMSMEELAARIAEKNNPVPAQYRTIPSVRATTVADVMSQPNRSAIPSLGDIDANLAQLEAGKNTLDFMLNPIASITKAYNPGWGKALEFLPLPSVGEAAGIGLALGGGYAAAKGARHVGKSLASNFMDPDMVGGYNLGTHLGVAKDNWRRFTPKEKIKSFFVPDAIGRRKESMAMGWNNVSFNEQGELFQRNVMGNDAFELWAKKNNVTPIYKTVGKNHLIHNNPEEHYSGSIFHISNEIRDAPPKTVKLNNHELGNFSALLKGERPDAYMYDLFDEVDYSNPYINEIKKYLNHKKLRREGFFNSYDNDIYDTPLYRYMDIGISRRTNKGFKDEKTLASTLLRRAIDNTVVGSKNHVKVLQRVKVPKHRELFKSDMLSYDEKESILRGFLEDFHSKESFDGWSESLDDALPY